MIEPKSYRADLDDLRALSSQFGKAVPILAELIENRRCEMEANWTRKGVKTLPDELLLPIFKQAYHSLGSRHINIPSVRSNLFAKRVSQVCRRFRCIAFSCPELWGTIHSSQPKAEVTAFVERSHTYPLTILIYGKDHTRFGSDMSKKDLREFMEALAPCQERWKEMRITSTPSRTISQLMREVQEHIVSLPQLERLHFHRYKWDTDFDDHCDIAAWHAPNLRLFQGSGVVPTNFQSSTVSQFSLTCQINTIPEMFTGPIPESITYLSLKMLNVSDREIVAMGPSDEPVRLPGLETLEVVSSSPGTYTTFWVFILPRLEFPCLTRLHVRVAGDRVVDLFGRLGTHQFANLRELRFVCEDLATVFSALRSLAKFPLLEHVIVDDCCYSSYKDTELRFSNMPSLRTLKFARCRFNNMHGAEALAQCLIKVLDLTTFECLQFDCYDDFDELRYDRVEALRRYLKGKVRIVDCID
ncbi:hypothetical protein EW145_g674 [Phellinidium pouzarii]|uniref:Uncharacterized protein n=1 Tax=Phellinidium pouzarii TaxID=167371 RepID=A0A4S4LHF9_9AGAM|nr:hypothetical protein EW145_g674 [Phellinidium pouzarii]